MNVTLEQGNFALHALGVLLVRRNLSLGPKDVILETNRVRPERLTELSRARRDGERSEAGLRMQSDRGGARRNLGSHFD